MRPSTIRQRIHKHDPVKLPCFFFNRDESVDSAIYAMLISEKIRIFHINMLRIPFPFKEINDRMEVSILC